MIAIKRAYGPPEKGDGTRFLVDHLWPRGVKKERLEVESWIKDVAPSNQLRTWFGHDPDKWKEFELRYFAELNQNPEAWQPLLRAAETGDITLVYSARDTDRNNAVALKAYLEKKLRAKSRQKRGNLVSTYK